MIIKDDTCEHGNIPCERCHATQAAQIAALHTLGDQLVAEVNVANAQIAALEEEVARLRSG